MDLKRIIGGLVTTIIIGGSAYTISQSDVVNNFSKDTGMSQQQAEEYVKNVSKDDLVSWDKLGNGLISDSKDVMTGVNQIDCINYEYKWESITLSCEEGKSQLKEIGNSEATLGQAYIKLGSANASKEDIANTIKYIDILNTNYSLEIVSKALEPTEITEFKNSNSYNKATLKAALEKN